MKKMTILFLVLAILASFALMAQDDTEDLNRLRIKNKTFTDIAISMNSGEWAYYLTVPAALSEVNEDDEIEIFEEEAMYGVQPAVYDATVFACNTSWQATLDMTSNVWLNFPTCGEPPNQGAPTIEKIVPPDVANERPAPYRFQYGE